MNSLSSINKNNYFFEINKKQATNNRLKFKPVNPLASTNFTSSRSLESKTLQAYYLSKSPKVSFTRNLIKGKNNHLKYLGAEYSGDNTTVFRVHAPLADKINLQVAGGFVKSNYWEDQVPENCRTIPMHKTGDMFEIKVENTSPGDMYRFELVDADGNKKYRKDPRSFWQPNDTLGWSAIYDQKKYNWSDDKWQINHDSRKILHNDKNGVYGVPPGMFIQEIHLGVLGGYQKAKHEIDKIVKEGICNTVMIMPTGEFFGQYNWGYDECDKFAPESSRGTPDEFKALIDYCHSKGMNVILDVVPNHFGPVGCTVQDYGKAFDPSTHTPWGAGLNFKDPNSNYMPYYMIYMMMNWLVNFHIDGLRLDAANEIPAETIKKMAIEIRQHPETKHKILIAEDLTKGQNMIKPIVSSEIGHKNKEPEIKYPDNYGMDMHYMFDFKYKMLALLTNWNLYNVFSTGVDQLKSIFKSGLVSSNNEAKAFKDLALVFDHDSGNAFAGSRLITTLIAINLGLSKENEMILSSKVDKKPFAATIKLMKAYLSGDYDRLGEIGKEFGVSITKERFEEAYNRAKALNRLALGSIFMHPAQKMLFMGDQRGELAPFCYQAQYPENDMYQGNEEKYKGMTINEVIAAQKGVPIGKEAEVESRLNQKKFTDTKLRKDTLKYTQKLKQLCVENPSLNNGSYDNLVTEFYPESRVLHVHRYEGDNETLAVMNFSDNDYNNFNIRSFPDGEWTEILNSNDKEYGGNGSNLNTGKQVSRKNNKVDLPKQSIVIFKRNNN